ARDPHLSPGFRAWFPYNKKFVAFCLIVMLYSGKPSVCSLITTKRPIQFGWNVPANARRISALALRIVKSIDPTAN
ncbi:MAG TPA: hypothetical protein VGA68_02975, partial [Woeseiaceae bacterium]